MTFGQKIDFSSLDFPSNLRVDFVDVMQISGPWGTPTESSHKSNVCVGVDGRLTKRQYGQNEREHGQFFRISPV